MKKLLCLILSVFLLLTLCGCNIDFDKALSTTQTDTTDQKNSDFSDKSEPDSTTQKPQKVEKPETAPTMWKKAYTDYINNVDLDEYNRFALIYIDDNDIPELFLMGSFEAAGEMILSYYDGKTVEYIFSRTNGISYAEKGGLILHSNGHMGYYYTDLYSLNNGKFEVLHKSEIVENYYLYDEGYDFSKYTVDGAECDYNTYHQAINGWTAGIAMTPAQQKAMSYDEIIYMLKE